MNQGTEWSDNSEPESKKIKGRVEETEFAAGVGVDLKAAAEWRVGDTILDLYKIKGVLGSGGFSTVYRVTDTRWNVDLALKRPHVDRLNEASKEDFRREAETWLNLGLHPHIVSCYYMRELGGIPHVFAECVEGGSLSEWIGTRKLYEGGKDDALKRILDVAIQIAWGLHYAHERGLVHQDVKPANVMMTPEGVAKVIGFGLAVDSRAMTPAYASPEQLSGLSLSSGTDIWSWAVSVLEMFTGEVIWVSGIVAADVLEEFVGPASDNDSIPSMPGSVRSLLLDCLKNGPSDRPKDMMEVANQLGSAYQEITGGTFSRQLPKTGQVVANNLNNRAVSLLDLIETRRNE